MRRLGEIYPQNEQNLPRAAVRAGPRRDLKGPGPLYVAIAPPSTTSTPR